MLFDIIIFVSRLQDALDGADYTAHLLMHLIDGNDTVNAKFLYQRVPESISRQNQAFIRVWSVVSALSKSEFGNAISLLR